jgi:hypothetical protein
MSTSPPNSQSFHPFPLLAAELRNQIWHLALPDTTLPALVPWKPGCWILRGEEPDLEFRFAHELLSVPISIPMAFVNREARSIARAYVREIGLRTQLRDGDQYPMFTRPFDRQKDAVYMQPAQLIPILDDANERLERPDMVGRHVAIWSEIRRIAMPYAGLVGGDTMEYIGELEFQYCSVDELLVVVNEFERLERGEACAFEQGMGPVYCWTREDQVFRRLEEEGGGEHGGKGDGEVNVGEIVCTEDVRLAFSGTGPRFGCGQSRFTVRPVNAMRA